MEYRKTVPRDLGFEDHDEMQEALQDYVQGVMTRAEPNDIMDTLVIMANVADIRSIHTVNLGQRHWYRQLQTMVRGLLDTMQKTSPATVDAKPDAALEDPTLYFPDITGRLKH